MPVVALRAVRASVLMTGNDSILGDARPAAETADRVTLHPSIGAGIDVAAATGAAAVSAGPLLLSAFFAWAGGCILM